MAKRNPPVNQSITADQPTTDKRGRKRADHAKVKCARSGCRKRFVQRTTGHIYCSPECRSIVTPDNRQRNRAVIPARNCDNCAVSFQPLRADQRFCGANCREESYKKDFMIFTLKIPKILLTDNPAHVNITVSNGQVIAINRTAD